MTDKEIVYNSLIPELSVSNIDISKKFYLDLGFKIRYERKQILLFTIRRKSDNDRRK